MWTSLSAVLLLALQACRTDAKSVVHETASARLPTGWKYLGPANDATPISLSIALKQPDLQELRARLDDISNPSHKDYGAHLTKELVRRYGEVPEATVQTVVAWLGHNNVTEIATEDAWVRFNATIGQVNALLSCNMSRYQKSDSQDLLYRASVYSLPEDLSDRIDYIYPVTQFLSSKKSKRSPDASPAIKRAESGRGKVSSRAGTSFICTCSTYIRSFWGLLGVQDLTSEHL